MAGCAHCDSDHRAKRSEGTIVIGLAGNPNTGKSSIFNFLTGAKQHVGNWPWKTVSKAEGTFTHHDHVLQVVDLPGTYSLNAASPEEMIARDYLIHDRPDAVITVVDASNLQRQIGHTMADINSPKVESLKQTLQAMNPDPVLAGPVGHEQATPMVRLEKGGEADADQLGPPARRRSSLRSPLLAVETRPRRSPPSRPSTEARPRPCPPQEWSLSKDESSQAISQPTRGSGIPPQRICGKPGP